MPTNEEALRNEQDLFRKEEAQEPAREHAAVEAHDKLLKLEQRGVDEKRSAEAELRPEAAEELSHHMESSDEAVQKLFEHFVEERLDDDEEEVGETTVQVDVRQRGRNETETKGQDLDDVYTDGVEGDFQRDAKVVVGEMDTRPEAALSDAFSPSGPDAGAGGLDEVLFRKRRRGTGGVDEPMAIPETDAAETDAAETESPTTAGSQQKSAG